MKVSNFDIFYRFHRYIIIYAVILQEVTLTEIQKAVFVKLCQAVKLIFPTFPYIGMDGIE